MEVHRRHLAKLWVLLVEIQTLRLANVRASCYGQIHHALLLDLPDRLIHFTKVLRDLRNVLDASVVCDDLILYRRCPEINLK